MTTQPQPEALRLAEAMEKRVIPRWVHATGETPRQSGFAADAECQAAAAELRRLHAECEALRKLSADRLEQITAHRQYALRWHDECEALQKRLNDATTPDMFWDASDPELYGNDVEELASEYDGGSVFRVDCAKRLPSFSIRVTGADGAYEHIDAARAAKEQA